MDPRHKVRTEANRATDGPRHKGRARALAYIMERYGVPTTSASPLAARVFRMDRWVPLAPLRVTPVAAHVPDKEKWVEKDPDDDIPSLRGLSRKVVLQILDYVPLYDLPRVAMASRECQVLVNKEKLWKWRWDRLAWQKTNVLSDPLLDATPEPIPLPAWANPAPVPSAPSCKASKTVDLLSDLDFDTSFVPLSASKPYSRRVQRAYAVLRPYLLSLLESPSPTSSWLFTKCTNVSEQCALVCMLARFVSVCVLGVPAPRLEDESAIQSKLQQATMALCTQLRTAFVASEEQYMKDPSSAMAVASMKQHAELAWSLRHVHDALGIDRSLTTDTRPSLVFSAQLYDLGGSVIAQTFLASRPVLTSRVPFSPHDALDANHAFCAGPVQDFVQYLERVLLEECAMIESVFPPAQPVHIALLERVVHDIVADYVVSLLQEAREASTEAYLDAFVQSCVEMQRLCQVPALDTDEARAMVDSVWLTHVDEYINMELAWQLRHLKDVCDQWLRDLDSMLKLTEAETSSMAPHSAAEKRSFMASFKHALLRPAVRVQPAPSAERSVSSQDEAREGYVGLGHAPGGMEERVDEEEEAVLSYAAAPASRHPPTTMASLLNVETAVDMVNLTRVSLQRLDALRQTRTKLSSRAQSACIQALVQLYASLNDEHMAPGFQTAEEQIRAYDPAKNDRSGGRGEAADHVGPLLVFFELVHIGDTIQLMMQVFFERLDPGILGKADFTNAAVREKRRFESNLDDHVAVGLSAGVELLVQQIEYIVTVHQNPRDFYPESEAAVDVSQPTAACIECCATMQTYCHLLAACADKALLDVFYQEIGFRLYSILCKHLKRQIISTYGGVRAISDLNHYYHFIETMKQPSLTTLFGALKRVATLFIVDEPKELAKLIQDTTLSNGTMRPEEMYEFLRARCDFKTIESKVDAEMYGIKVREDCVIA